MTRMIVRLLLLLWGIFLIAYAVVGLLDPGFLESETRYESGPSVMLRALCIVAIGILLVLPQSIYSPVRRRKYLGGLMAICISSLVIISSALGHPFRWHNVLFVLLFYALPSVMRLLLYPRQQESTHPRLVS